MCNFDCCSYVIRADNLILKQPKMRRWQLSSLCFSQQLLKSLHIHVLSWQRYIKDITEVILNWSLLTPATHTSQASQNTTTYMWAPSPGVTKTGLGPGQWGQWPGASDCQGASKPQATCVERGSRFTKEAKRHGPECTQHKLTTRPRALISLLIY